MMLNVNVGRFAVFYHNCRYNDHYRGLYDLIPLLNKRSLTHLERLQDDNQEKVSMWCKISLKLKSWDVYSGWTLPRSHSISRRHQIRQVRRQQQKGIISQAQFTSKSTDIYNNFEHQIENDRYSVLTQTTDDLNVVIHDNDSTSTYKPVTTIDSKTLSMSTIDYVGDTTTATTHQVRKKVKWIKARGSSPRSYWGQVNISLRLISQSWKMRQNLETLNFKTKTKFENFQPPQILLSHFFNLPVSTEYNIVINILEVIIKYLSVLIMILLLLSDILLFHHGNMMLKSTIKCQICNGIFHAHWLLY